MERQHEQADPGAASASPGDPALGLSARRLAQFGRLPSQCLIRHLPTLREADPGKGIPNVRNGARRHGETRDAKRDEDGREGRPMARSSRSEGAPLGVDPRLTQPEWASTIAFEQEGVLSDVLQRRRHA